MGFEVEDTEVKLVFPDGRYAGAEVFARCSLSLGEYFEFIAVRESDREQGQRDYARSMFEAFAPYLVRWNLQRQGEPIPCDVEGLWSLERELSRQIIRAWQRAVEEVPGPLEQPSSGGQPSAELEMPMEPLSESQAS